MNSTASLHRVQPRPIWTVGEYLLSKLVSQHLKRIIAISTLSARFSRLDRLEREGVDRLNALMVLTIKGRQDSLIFPSRFQHMVWGNTDLDETLSPEILSRPMSEAQVRDVSVRIVDMSPKWLRYGKTFMIDDVCTLVREMCQERTMVAAAA